jgi:two-component system OmpR family response regulator
MPTILVAQTNEDMRALLALALPEAGYEVLAAEDGATALQLAHEHQPDLLLLDALLPDMSGYDVTRALQAEPRTASIPLLFLTAKHEIAEHDVDLNRTIDTVWKPFDALELLSRIEVALRGPVLRNPAGERAD